MDKKSKKKYFPAKTIRSLGELLQQEFVIYKKGNYQKTYHYGWVLGWQIGWAIQAIIDERLYTAQKIEKEK